MGRGVRMGGGTSMQGIEVSAEAGKRMARAKKRREAYWASLAGPVTVRRVGDPEPPRAGLSEG